jgi:hypothetical protein
MNILKALTFGVAASLLAVSPAAADVQLTMQNGRVSLVAKDVTVRQILTEWARVGQTKIVNLERIPGGLVSLELRNMPETQALDILLRSVSGYLAAPRPIEAANLSQFDRIVVMATSAAPRAPVTGSPQAPTFQPPQFNQPPQPDDEPDDVRPVPNIVVPGQNRGPVFNTFPQPLVVNPQGGPQGVGGVPQGAPQAAPTFPGAPTPGFGGVSVPGMIVQPPPQQPGQPGQPVPSGSEQPVRRPGGPESR